MYKVIGKTNTRAMRVLWAMHEIGLDFDHIKAAAQSAEAQKANISGKCRA
jgi:glutathione S-transferase